MITQDYLPCYIKSEILFDTRTDLLIDRLVSYLYTHDDLSVYLFYEHERTMC